MAACGDNRRGDDAAAGSVQGPSHFGLQRIGRRALSSLLLKGIDALALLAMFVALSRGMDQNAYGLINSALFLVSFLALLTPLGFTVSAYRFLPEYSATGDRCRAVGFVRCSLGLTLLSAFGVSAAIGVGVGVLPLQRTSEWVVGFALVPWLLPVYSLMILRRKLSEGSGNLRASVLPDLALPVVVVAGALTFPELTAEEAAAWLATGAACALVSGLATLSRSQLLSGCDGTALLELRSWLSVSLPLVTVGVGNVVMSRADAIILSLFRDMSEVGEYAVVLRVVPLASFVMNGVYVVIAPAIAQAFVRGDVRDTVRLLLLGSGISLAGAVVVILPLLEMPEAVLGIFGPGYTDATEILVILTVSQLIGVLFGLPSVTLALVGGHLAFAKIMTLGIVANIAGNLVVAPVYGGQGVAGVTLATVALVKVAQTIALILRLREGAIISVTTGEADDERLRANRLLHR